MALTTLIGHTTSRVVRYTFHHPLKRQASDSICPHRASLAASTEYPRASLHTLAATSHDDALASPLQLYRIFPKANSPSALVAVRIPQTSMPLPGQSLL